MTMFSKNLGGAWPLWPPGYAYAAGYISIYRLIFFVNPNFFFSQLKWTQNVLRQ